RSSRGIEELCTITAVTTLVLSGYWRLDLLWMLDVGAWSFPVGICILDFWISKLAALTNQPCHRILQHSFVGEGEVIGAIFFAVYTSWAEGIRAEMSKIICICPTHRDHRELSALQNGHVFLHHDYASVGLEDLTANECPSVVFSGHPEQEIDAILKRCREERVQGVITTDDYPGTTRASV